MFTFVCLIAVTLLSLVHVFIGRLHFLDANPAGWRSGAGGVGIAYVFLVLFPKLAYAQQALTSADDTGFYGYLEHHSYLLALIGMIVYYGFEPAVERNLRTAGQSGVLRSRTKVLTYVYASGMSGYFLLVAYLITELHDRGYVSVVLFTLAMLVHFVAIDHVLREKYGGLYDGLLRWVFAAATLAGWFIGAATQIDGTTLALWNSLFAGALIGIAIREELPDPNEGSFVWFLSGTIAYTSLLLLIEFVHSSQ